MCQGTYLESNNDLNTLIVSIIRQLYHLSIGVLHNVLALTYIFLYSTAKLKRVASFGYMSYVIVESLDCRK